MPNSPPEPSRTLWKFLFKFSKKFKNPKNYSTAVNYKNRYRQINLGRTEKRGTDNGQWFYRMRCEDCLYEYLANGSDIHLKKCPACQGGADSGKK